MASVMIRRQEANASNRRSIVLIGVTGVGKSTFGNTILGLTPSPGESISTFGFPTSSGTEGCTREAKCLNGWWRGDTAKPIRVIDTPGHGDPSGDDAELRESMVECLKQERFVHAFLWFMNSESPRFDKQDKEFYAIFSEIFGLGFLNNLIIVFTKFSYSPAEAFQRRKRTNTSLEKMVEGMRKEIRLGGNEVPIFVIDAIHNPDNQSEVQVFNRGIGELWSSIQRLGKRPVENIKMIRDEFEMMKIQAKKISETLERTQKAHSKQMQQLLDEMKSSREMLERSLKTEREEKEKLKEQLQSLETKDKDSQEQIKEIQSQLKQVKSKEEKNNEEISKLTGAMKRLNEQHERELAEAKRPLCALQ